MCHACEIATKNKDLRSRSIANYMTSEGNSALLPENVDRSSRFTFVNLYTSKYLLEGFLRNHSMTCVGTGH